VGCSLLVRNKTGAEKRLRKIICTCGAEILLVPDVQMMNEAIERHVQEHKSNLPPKERLDYEQKIRDHLISQIFEKASALK